MKKYVSIFGLRTHDTLNGRLVIIIINVNVIKLFNCTFVLPLKVTEIIYVHTKLMIVDDRYTIIGSGKTK